MPLCTDRPGTQSVATPVGTANIRNVSRQASHKATDGLILQVLCFDRFPRPRPALNCSRVRTDPCQVCDNSIATHRDQETEISITLGAAPRRQSEAETMDVLTLPKAFISIEGMHVEPHARREAHNEQLLPHSDQPSATQPLQGVRRPANKES